jgi:two-component system CheB/CheR fusion protein
VVGVGASAGGLEAVSQLLRALPVVGAADGMRVERGRVDVIPPNRMLGISKGALRPMPPTSADHPHQPVDFFFRALATDQAAPTVGVVLSGTGDDGTLGLEAIKAADGITFAQASLEDYRLEAEFPTIGRKTFLLNARRLVKTDRDAGGILLAIEDVSERR